MGISLGKEEDFVLVAFVGVIEESLLLAARKVKLAAIVVVCK